MSQPHLDSACRTWMAGDAAQRLTGDHPTPEQLAAWTERRLEGEAYDTVRQHLLDCGDCMALWRGLRQLEETPPIADQPPPSEFERALFRRSLATHLAAENESENETETEPPEAPGTTARITTARIPSLRRSRAPLLTTLAASLLAAVLGLSWWNLELRQDLSTRMEPQVNIGSLHPLALSKRNGAEQTPTEFLDGAVGGTIYITPPLLPEGSDPDRLAPPTTFTLRIFDATGHLVRPLPGLRLDNFGNLAFHLPPGALESGQYRLELSAGEGSEVLETYSLEVR